MEENYTLYDKVVSTTLINYLVENRRNYGLVLSPFNPTNIDYLYAFEIALLLSDSIHEKFYLDMNFFNYWKFKLRNWSVRKNFKRYTNNTPIIKMDLDKILEYMKKELSLENNIFEQIYNEYYKIGSKNRNITNWKRRKAN